ncbi:MAG: Hpt domain-containing protein [Gammaproteobacteria bacterium]|nr:Hpt domain-containing protein [Gammaproteobacteria bacterium]
MAEIASQTLDIAGRELNATLAEARTALENFVEQSENFALLERSAAELHQVQGVLRVLEIYGAALLVEEMQHVVRYLIEGAHERKSQAEALDAVMRAMVQLPGYLERVLAGGRDLALVLLPLLNDLRAVRGSALLSEGTLLLLNLKSDRDAQPAAPAPGEPVLGIEQWARRLRARFQVGLIGWIRGERLEQNLEILAAVAHKLEQIATRQPVFQLWWVTGAVIEALRENGIEGGVSVKRLLGLADREIRRLYEQGEARYCQNPPVELLNNLLYYVARAEGAGPRVAAVRASFRLGELLPVDDAIEQERESLSAPSVKLMQTVAAAIREDLAKVKDVLDIFVRRGGGYPEELAPQVDLLRKIGDTLGVLGLGELRARVQEECARLEDIVAGRLPGDEANLVQVATTLIGVEDRLDEQLVGMILPRARGAQSAEGEDADFQHVQSAVLRECIVNLARVKEAVAQNVGGTLDATGLDGWAELMRGISAGLLMLGKARAVEIAGGIIEQLKMVMRPGGPAMPVQNLDRLADAIVSLEYYMETLQAGRGDPWYMLDNARTCLDSLQQVTERAVPTVAPVDPTVFAQTLRIARAEPVAEVVGDLTATDVPERLAPTLAPHGADRMPAEHADPELLALFVDEAREALSVIEGRFPLWEQNPLEEGALTEMRRAFHTLKGSGRMVGARELAEFAWAIENLLNRLLDRTVTSSPAILATLREALRFLPKLIDELESEGSEPTDVSAIIARAHALAAGRAPETLVPPGEEEAEAGLPPSVAPAPKAVSAAPAPEEPPAPAPGSDDALREIYARETRSNIATVREFLAAEQVRAAPHLLAEDVYRACHTLSGSSKMAEARHGVRLAEPLDHWLRKAFDSALGLGDDDLRLLADCMDAMEAVALHLDEATGFFLAHDVLLERIGRAERELDERIRAAALAAQPPPAAATPALQGEAAPVDYDPEIAAIFCEEATELIEAAQAALLTWNETRGDAERLAGLKRPLHTLKGGARMAGVTPMGDLSHELESLVTLISSGAISADNAAGEALQASLDELARMREGVAGGRPVAPAHILIARIRALAPGQPAAEVAPPVERSREPAEPLLPLLPADAAGMPEPVETAAEILGGDREVPRPGLPPDELSAGPEAVLPAAPAPVPPGREPLPASERAEMARVDAALLDQLLNNAGEVSIGRARLEQQLGSIDFNLAELSRTVTRLKEQLRKLEIETETQILHRHEQEAAHRSDFDPLELDRYSTMQQFSRALAETASDVASIQQLLETLTQDAQNLLQQQSRTITEMQNGLLRTRMVPFQRHVQRLARIVRQAASETGKKAELLVEGASGELDRQVLERMLPPFEHMLRNAVVHGLESVERRRAAGKDESGRITLGLRREGAEVIVTIADDGAGMNLEAIRSKGAALGLIAGDQVLSDEDAMQLILEPGFSTAGTVTQQAGRGVGMDIVATEVKKLGGALHMQTTAGQGTEFTIRLPFTLAIGHALVVRTGDEHYALPLTTVEGVVRLSKAEVATHLHSEAASFEHGGQKYRFQHLASFVGLEPSPLPEGDVTVPVVLVRAGEHSTGLITDELIGSREIVVKSVGPQISSIRGIAGATILGDGRIVVILDIAALLRAEWLGRTGPVVLRERGDRRVFALVVDDSITVRRVTQRLLERNGMRVLTARDGLDAVALLQEHVPDIILLDIEMPRMDGYGVAAHVRNDPRLADVPIIMITSRVGEKHRARAIELGVDDYLGKPYQEAQLLEAIEPLVMRRRARLAGRSATTRIEGRA